MVDAPLEALDPLELQVLDEDGSQLEPTPIVLVEGYGAGANGEAIFRGLDELLNVGKPPDAPARRLLVVKCGSFSSVWDRAIEIYYALKGGRVDYGEEHAREFQHSRYGRTHEHGLYENWSEDYPLHFIAHSFGGPTIFHLQQMLGKSMPGSPGMMLSISCISSPFRGTPMTSISGQTESGGHERFSLGWILSAAFTLAHTTKLLGGEMFDVNADQWTKDESGPYSVLRNVANFLDGKSLSSSIDSAGHNMLLGEMERLNESTELCSKTFYRAYAASAPLPKLLPPFAYTAHRMSTYDGFPDDDPAWRENDWVVPLKSQFHPKDCHETTCLHLPSDVEEPPPVPGAWHVVRYHNVSHFGLVDYLWKLRSMSPNAHFFWTSHGDWLREVDMLATAHEHERVKEAEEQVRTAEA